MDTPHVLLVEDDPDSAEAIRMLLEAHGLDVEWAASGGEAIVMYDDDRNRGNKVHAILLDLMLPDMDGVTLAKQLARRGPLPPLIIHSAASRQATLAAGRALGAATVLRKPAEWELIQKALERCGAYPAVPSA